MKSSDVVRLSSQYSRYDEAEQFLGGGEYHQDDRRWLRCWCSYSHQIVLLVIPFLLT